MNSIMIIVPVLLTVAFFTLLERKIMGLTHFRLGPNKMGLQGIFQPFNDAIKLISKESYKLSKTNNMTMIISPFIILMLALMSWLIMPLSANTSKTNFNILLFMMLSSMSVYFFIMSGWSSYAKYSIMGAYRSTAQTISYEISMLLIMLPSIIIIKMMTTQSTHFILMAKMWPMILPLMLLWLISILAETNRTPFDLTEGESELVSGYNTEYSNGQFSMIFIAEYSFLMFMSMMTFNLFFNNSSNYTMMLITLIIMIFFSWTRVSFPRMRYDFLMMMTWKTMMPISIMLLIMIMFFI